MWRRVWGAASCLTLLVFACGKSERDSADEGSGTAGRTTAGTSTVIGGGGTTASTSTGGTNVTSSSGKATGGMNVGLGGAPPEPGEGGAPAAAGAPAAGGASACSGYYHACGCGCCELQPTPATCVYPDLGQDLTKTSEADLARGMDPSCANVGCSIGQDTFCCAAAPASNDGAKYETSVFIGAYNRIRLHKMTTDCSTFVLQQAPSVGPADPPAFPVEVPEGWKLENVTTLPCISSAIGPNAIGAIGKFSLRAQDGACVVDAHLTAFFTTDNRDLNTVRFDADGVPVDIPVGECQ